MSLDKKIYKLYLDILKEELLPATGCTEPIAIAYAGAKAKEALGCFPDKVMVKCSGNIIKNAKSVSIPNTGNLKGIKAAAIAGIVAGDAALEMRVIENIKEDEITKIKKYMETDLVTVDLIKNVPGLKIVIEMWSGDDCALVEIVHKHTSITRIEKNGINLYEQKNEASDTNISNTDRSSLNIKDIFEFANTVNIEEIKEVLDAQIEHNVRIANEGLQDNYGVNVGKMLLESYGNDIFTKMKAYASAASDARMNGCNVPVVTNSGSGNQGITVSIPVIIYGKEKKVSNEKIYRALVLSNLIAVHQKTGIGRLSAYCGAVSAACGSGAGITYMENGTLEQIEKTMVNTLANVSGIVCDGAKSSCAAKIASSLDAAFMAYFLAMKDRAFEENSGIIKDNIEGTISAVSRLAREGMKETDVELLKIMIED